MQQSKTAIGGLCLLSCSRSETSASHRTTPVQVNSTSAFRPGQWYKLGIAQNPFPGGPTVAVASPSSALVRNLTTMFSNPVLQATAAAAAENIWSIVPRGTLARAGGVPTPAVGARPLPPLLLKAAEYAPASLFSHMLEDGDVALPPRPALAAFGTIDAYLCEYMGLGAWAGQLDPGERQVGSETGMPFVPYRSVHLT